MCLDGIARSIRTGHYRPQLIHLRLHGRYLPAFSGSGRFRCLLFLCIERNLSAVGRDDHEISASLPFGYRFHDNRIAGRPPHSRKFAVINREKAQHHSILRKFFHRFRRKVAPNGQLVRLPACLLQPPLQLLDGSRSLQVLPESLLPVAERLARLKSLLFGEFGETALRRTVLFEFGQHCPLLAVRFPARGRYIDQTELLQRREKLLLPLMIEHKSIFAHLHYHTASGSCCSCLLFTIFCALLERFSSSSRKRLILRMAVS